MPHHPPEIGRSHRLIGAVALLLVVLALIGNVAAFAWMRPYGILRPFAPLAEAREEIHSKFVGEIDDQALLDAALKGMADALGDKNTEYLSAKELAYFNEHVGGAFTGIGAEIDIHNDRLRIIAPLDDSPAWNAGVLPGDIVLEIDGQDTLGIDIIDAMGKLKGEAGTDVTIKVRHLDGAIQTLTITRAKIEVASVRGYRRDPGNGFKYMIDPDNKIAYVKLTQFGDQSYNEMQDVLTRLKGQGMRALILDLRDNGGGLLDAAVAISDLFLTQGKTIVSTEGRAEPRATATSTRETLLPDTPLVVLINQNSASASEIVAGAIRDNDRGLLIGTRSFGKGSVQQLIPLGDGSSALKLTTAYWYIPSGKLIHRKDDAKDWGVDPSPDSFVPMDDEQFRAMLMRRRAIEADDPYAKRQGPITPAWLKENLLDDQLAAALDAAQQRLTEGGWPKVGVGKDIALAEPSEEDQLAQRKQELQEMIEQIDEQLRQLAQDADEAGEIEEEAALPQPVGRP
ncbi:MAG: S41 family peptidase [Phycisphaeraceae bacterium]